MSGLGVERVGGDEGDGPVLAVLAAGVVLVFAGHGKAGEQVSEVGDLVVLGFDVKLGGDAAVGGVVGGQQVRCVACGVAGALDGLAVDGVLADGQPAGRRFLAQ